MKSFLPLYLLLCLTFAGIAQQQNNIESSIHLLNVRTLADKVIYKELRHIEAPNWSKDGSYLVVNSNGLLYKLPVTGLKGVLGSGRLEKINTSFAVHCNNDHGISPDGTQLVISNNIPGKGSAIYTLPINGGNPFLITPLTPSYWHGWSPDGTTLTYCAQRNGNFDVYTIAAKGGEEKRLTDNPGLDDGPEYSPDGKFIYFNSYRNNQMQIWKMKADGGEQQQLSNDSLSNWFPHPSPNGKMIVYISYLENQGSSHPFGKNVKLRKMTLKNKKITDITPVFFGGQGSINVPSWSPNSTHIAYISYRLINSSKKN